MKKLGLLILLLTTPWLLYSQENNYEKLWKDPVLKKRIDTGIERFRKGDVVIHVSGRDGKPVRNATVEIVQETHEFLFGCNLFVLGQMQTEELNRKYESAFSHLFNYATLPFYWRDLEPEEGKPRYSEGSEFIWRRPPPDLLLKWCKEHQIIPKGHALMYNRNAHMPDWTEKENPELFLEQAKVHIEGIAARYGNDILCWDVVNEERHRTRFPETGHRVPEDYLAWCFRIAGSLFPDNARLLYNDDTQNHPAIEEYEGYVNTVRNQGLKIDGMGLQFHLFSVDARKKFLEGEIYPPSQLVKAYDHLVKTNLPLYITEITIPGGGENGNALQAKIVEDLYRLWFSTENMAGITWWNLGDGTAHKGENTAKAGLLDENMNPKPAYQVLDRLINHEWKTNLSAKTGSDGKISFRGYYGRYSVRLKKGGRENVYQFELERAGKDNTWNTNL